MKAIILAAGQGKRLLPLTLDKPKCMVEIFGKPMIFHLLDTLRLNNITDISIVGGYKEDVLKSSLKNLKGVKFYTNIHFDTSNMVSTLFKAREEMNDDLIVTYSDIIYSPHILKALMDCPDHIAVTIDKDWKRLWEIRMDNPLDDAETLKIRDGYITHLGKKTRSFEDIQGQYMGLIKFSKAILPEIRQFYATMTENCRKSEISGLEQMFMTDFLQALIDRGFKIKAVPIHGGWLEIDSLKDLEIYQNKPELIQSSRL